MILEFFYYSNSSRKITCPSGKLKTEFTSPIATPTSPGLSDTTFFAHCTPELFIVLFFTRNVSPRSQCKPSFVLVSKVANTPKNPYLHRGYLSIQTKAESIDGTNTCIYNTKIGKRTWCLVNCHAAVL